MKAYTHPAWSKFTRRYPTVQSWLGDNPGKFVGRLVGNEPLTVVYFSYSPSGKTYFNYRIVFEAGQERALPSDAHVYPDYQSWNAAFHGEEIIAPVAFTTCKSQVERDHHARPIQEAQPVTALILDHCSAATLLAEHQAAPVSAKTAAARADFAELVAPRVGPTPAEQREEYFARKAARAAAKPRKAARVPIVLCNADGSTVGNGCHLCESLGQSRCPDHYAAAPAVAKPRRPRARKPLDLSRLCHC